MLYLTIILVCIGVPSFLLQAAILKSTVFVFRKGRLPWRTAFFATLIVVFFGICLSISGCLSFWSLAIIAFQLLCILGIILLPAILIRRSLHVKTIVSITMILVATVANVIAGGAYVSGIRAFLLQAFRIPSSGMSPTLSIGDYMLVNKLSYRFGTPNRGDIVVFRYPADTSKDFVQRVVAVGGDTVEIHDKKLLVNGEGYEKDPGVNLDPAILPPDAKNPRDNLSPVTVPPGCLFVLGDNRDHSFDSRYWGFVKLENIAGKPFLIYWSYDSKTNRIRTDRIGERIG